MSETQTSTPQSVACFQFTSNSIQLAASFEVLTSWNKENNLDVTYFWLGSNTSYPSRMARGMDTIMPWKRMPKVIRKSLKAIPFHALETRNVLPQSRNTKRAVTAFLTQLERVRSIQEFQSLTWEGINPGGALANSFVYETERQTFSISEDKTLITLLLRSYLEVYFGTQIIIDANELASVLIYNGRFLHERAVWDACRSRNIDVFIFETTRNRYHLRKNEGFHDRILNQNYMKKLWIEKSRSLSKNELEILGSKYFFDLESKKNRFFNYSAEPSNLELVSDYFVYFSNSDDEAVGFWESWNEPFLSQIDLIRNLQEYFEKQESSHLYVRLHPNLANKSKTEQAKWDCLQGGKFSTIIGPSTPASSYRLLRGSKGVISYGSTIGIEAAFHQVPSAVLADCWYDELGVADKLTDMESLYHWIENIAGIFNESVLMERKQNSLSRGLWLELSGSFFPNTSMKELDWGSWEVERFCQTAFHRSLPKHFFAIFSNKVKRRMVGLSP